MCSSARQEDRGIDKKDMHQPRDLKRSSDRHLKVIDNFKRSPYSTWQLFPLNIVQSTIILLSTLLRVFIKNLFSKIHMHTRPYTKHDNRSTAVACLLLSLSKFMYRGRFSIRLFYSIINRTRRWPVLRFNGLLISY